MPAKSKETMLWEQVRKEEDAKEAILMIADYTEAAINESIAYRKTLHDDITQTVNVLGDQIAELRKILQGNGDPTHSVIARLAKIEESQRKSSENANKAVWIVLSAVIVQVVLYLLKVL